MVNGLRALWDVVLEHQQSIIVAGVLLSFIGSVVVRSTWSRLRGGSHLEFGLLAENAGATNAVLLEITNVGDRLASDVRLSWTPRSSMRIAAIPQPFLISPNKSVHVRVRMDLLDYLLRRPDAADKRPIRDRALGWLEVTYRSGRRKVRSGRAIVPHRTGDALALGELVGLAGLPRRTPREAIPFLDWLDEYTGRKRRRHERAERDQEQQLAQELAWAWRVIADHGIEVRPANNSRAVEDRLLDELSRRGWKWEFIGTSVKATKTWTPSSSFTIPTERESLVDAVAVTLAIAITEDEERQSANQ